MMQLYIYRGEKDLASYRLLESTEDILRDRSPQGAAHNNRNHYLTARSRHTLSKMPHNMDKYFVQMSSYMPSGHQGDTEWILRDRSLQETARVLRN